jgi:hypothetical protein
MCNARDKMDNFAPAMSIVLLLESIQLCITTFKIHGLKISMSYDGLCLENGLYIFDVSFY